MKIRLMRMSDFEEIYQFWKKMPGVVLAPYQIEKEDTHKMLKLNPYSNFVAVEGEKIVGTILAIFNGRRGWIYHLAVHLTFQRFGIGSILMKKSEVALKKVGCRRILLAVDEDNFNALNFYNKNGYKVIQNCVWMGKTL